MYQAIKRYQARKDGDESEFGFTLIELLIVIVVLGILAAVTVFALSGVSGTSAQAACNSDASSVNTAIAAFEATNGGTVPAASDLTANALGGPYLQSFPTSSHYTITVVAGAVKVQGNVITSPATVAPTNTWTPGSAFCGSAYVK